MFDPTLTLTDRERYARHLSLPGFGELAQLKLKQARVLLVGAGGLGCPIGLYLAAAGVGTLGLVDDDQVALSNLQRQVAHTTARVGQSKVESLLGTLHGLNPSVDYSPYAQRVALDNVEALISGYDLVIDGTDNYATRFLLADATYLNGIPLLHGAVSEYTAQIGLFNTAEGPCFRCLYGDIPRASAIPDCATTGILGVVPGTTGLMMATEAIKFLVGIGTSLAGSLLRYNALEQTIQRLTLSKDSGCRLCGGSPDITALDPVRYSEASHCGSKGAEQLTLSWQEALQRSLQAGGTWIDVREDWEYQSGHLPQAVSVPLSQLQADIGLLTTLRQPFWLYCKSGRRSLEAVRLLNAAGVTESYSITGGWQAYSALAPETAL